MKRPKNWKYKLDEDYHFRLEWVPDDVVLDLPFFRLRGKDATILKGYAWDGCSPSGVWWDTWDGPIEEATGKPITYYESLKHDVLYQYIRQIAKAIGRSIRWVRKKADVLFYVGLKIRRFEYAKLYYRFVRKLGWIPVWF